VVGGRRWNHSAHAACIHHLARRRSDRWYRRGGRVYLVDAAEPFSHLGAEPSCWTALVRSVRLQPDSCGIRL
jgi:hypothetical protein